MDHPLTHKTAQVYRSVLDRRAKPVKWRLSPTFEAALRRERVDLLADAKPDEQITDLYRVPVEIVETAEAMTGELLDSEGQSASFSELSNSMRIKSGTLSLYPGSIDTPEYDDH